MEVPDRAQGNQPVSQAAATNRAHVEPLPGKLETPQSSEQDQKKVTTVETQQGDATKPSVAPASNGAPSQKRQDVIARDRYNHQSLGPSLNTSVKKSRVLMIGAGGIGCELLKNLVLTGFGHIHIVDLDTIDLSNLNRQFLFRQEHIKKPKALVAKEAAQRFNPNVKITAHHANIKDHEFSVGWFKDFTIVFNALDNLDARRHVNKMCLAANVPLIESGTTGFNGQVQVIKKGITACYDCTPKETPKSFPVCTIRSTPSQPIHCIVWGKSYLLNEVFGTSEDQTAFDHTEDAANAKEIEELRRESKELKMIREAIGTSEFPRMLFNKVFKKDIERLRSVEDMWKSRQPPTPLTFNEILPQEAKSLDSKDKVLTNDQRAWTLEENLIVFLDSLDRLGQRFLELKKVKDSTAPEPIITFDKDDEDTLDFVAASANIRSIIFGIETKSRFDIKQMAGNIIPAIATTNAIVAGLCVLESFKVLKGAYQEAKEVFLTPFAPARLLAPDRLRQPNPDCPVCGVYNITVTVDLSRAVLGDIVNSLLKDQLSLGEREFVVNNEVGILYDIDETNNLPKKLAELGIHNGSFLTVIDDEDENPFVNIVINIEEGSFATDQKVFHAELADEAAIPRRTQRSSLHGFNGNGKVTGNQELHSMARTDAGPHGVKRSNQEGDEQPSKKAKTAEADREDVVLIEDAGGAIIIGDD